MEKCLHVSKIRPAWDHSILNPEKWMCYLCKTTESVWACLSCSNVACGRFNEKHALNHYQESKHAISIEVNEKYVYCYACDDYVFNDNAAGDIKLLRSALSAVATQKFTDIESRGRRLLRSYSHTGVVQRDNTDESDKLATAEWHQRQRLLAKTFLAWRGYVREEKAARLLPSSEQMSAPGSSSIAMTTSMSSIIMLRKSLAPGVTGLRNLGNTCYMNSVLQVLSHIEEFRDFFLKMHYTSDPSCNSPALVSGASTSGTSSQQAAKSSSSSPSALVEAASSHSPTTRSSETSGSTKPLKYARQTTVECFQHLMSGGKPKSPKQRAGGLNGGSSQQSPQRPQLICDVESTTTRSTAISLCVELHGLFRVLWSSKWAQVSPHAFLQAVWQAIPMFKGYAQHDAQEFLCELLDKIQGELDKIPKSQRRPEFQLLNNLFQGQLVSQVTCLSCGNISSRFEPYLDLSLEFPDRYQITKQNPRIAQDICHITEMLATFTEEEHLEGPIYACEKCNKKRRKSLGPVYTEAKKQLLINNLPPVLRLHLKRFRWSGRDHREKISTHVAADEELDLRPFCSRNVVQQTHKYRLFGVIIHHGKGFGSGHYTAYTWNKHADSWVNCNDSRMILSSLEDVLSAQAYILFYRSNIDRTTPFPSKISFSTPSTSLSSVSSEDTKKSASGGTSSRKRKTTPVSDTRVLRRSARRSGASMHSDISDVNNSNNKLNDETRLAASETRSLLLEAKNDIKVDTEISFKFSRRVQSSDRLPRRSSLKRPHDGSSTTQDNIQPFTKSAKRLSFGTDIFYSASPDKKLNLIPGHQNKSTVGQKVKGSSDSISKTGSGEAGETSRGKSKVKSATPAARQLKRTSNKHSTNGALSHSMLPNLKRRRSTFW